MYVVAIVSGGLDSVTMLYDLMRQYPVDVVSFNYGQRHKKELELLGDLTKEEGLDHTIVDIRDWGHRIVSSALTDPNVAVPEGHYAAANMDVTVVPGRNLIMLAIASSIAISRDASAVAMAVHTGDHAIYPDCRSNFMQAAELAIRFGNDKSDFKVLTPYIDISKNDIAVRAVQLGVPIEETWSCYKGGDIHCGRCGTCVERLEALHHAETVCTGFEDPTKYEDTEFWKEAIA
jgi:7-cyano-7-deazaguanine synthase